MGAWPWDVRCRLVGVMDEDWFSHLNNNRNHVVEVCLTDTQMYWSCTDCEWSSYDDLDPQYCIVTLRCPHESCGQVWIGEEHRTEFEEHKAECEYRVLTCSRGHTFKAYQAHDSRTCALLP